MFIECHNGSYFNTDKAVKYTVERIIGDNARYKVVAQTEDTAATLAEYGSKKTAQNECRNIIFWIRSVQGMERSDPAFQQKFIYSMPMR